jgi:hypothetical protein
MASHAIGTHRTERAEDILFLKQILRGSFNRELDVYTSILSVTECQGAYSPAFDRKILNDEVKQLFRDILTPYSADNSDCRKGQKPLLGPLSQFQRR